MFSKVLENEGCVCIKSTNVTEALKKISKGKPNAVFLDISDLRSDYNEIFTKIDQAHLQIPIVVLTSHVTDDLKNLAQRIGALEILEKPLALKQVRDSLEKIKAKIIE